MSNELDRHVLRKYRIQSRLGNGAYGVVWKATCKQTGEVVALKKCFDAFSNPTDAQRTFREVMFLYALSGHQNIVQILEVLRADNEKDLYVCINFMQSDLHAVIVSRILEDIHLRYVMYQICRAMKYMHSGLLIHRDLKPANVLLNSDCHVRICDFGLARSLESAAATEATTPESSPVLTDYVATRWYRAPEILLGCSGYTRGVDMWSVGCILGEMLAGKPLLPGSSTMNQLEQVVALTGPPTEAEVEAMQSPFASTMLASVGRRSGKRLPYMVPSQPPETMDLLQRCFAFDPNRRISAKECLEHAFLQQFHSPKHEPDCPHVIRVGLDDDKTLTVNEYRERLYRDMHDRKRQQQKMMQR